MDYEKHYTKLIDRARGRVLDGYVERHHVVPRCLGGSDDKGNIVQLTAEEHFVAHQLLCKIYPLENKLAFAVQSMTICNSYSTGRMVNKLFGWLRRRYGAAMKGRVKSPQERANIAEAGRNRETRVFGEEARSNMSEARRKTWEERRLDGSDKVIAAKAKASRLENGGYVVSDEARAKISASGKGRTPPNKGKSPSEETRQKMRDAKLGSTPWNKGSAKPKVEPVKMSPEEIKAIRKAAASKMWAERKANGTHSDLGKKSAETRRANGNYGVSAEVRGKISESLRGNNNRVKNACSKP